LYLQIRMGVTIVKALTVKLGFIPIKRKVFDLQAPIDQKYAIEKKIRELTPSQVQIIDCNDIAPDGLIYELDDIEKVVSKMKKEEVDGIFIPHCNFGTEEIAIRVAKQLKVPVLLWGGRDVEPVPEQIRLQDTQCGLFATSKGLMRAHIPFSYIVNCYVDDESFSKGYLQFLSVISVVQAFRKKMRILQIGSRPRPFFSVMYNESDLFGRLGVEVVPQPFHELVARMNEIIGNDSAEFCSEVKELTNRVDCSKMSEENVKKMVALRDSIHYFADINNCYAIATECWTLMPQTIGIRPCFVNGELTAMGLPVACETDVMGAVTSLLLQAADMNRNTTFFADVTIRHPHNENAELLWHCGPFPCTLKAPDEKGYVNALGKGQWRIKDGDITVCRLDGVDDSYKLFVGQGKSCIGPKTESTYVWFETDNWSRWEEKLIFGPYIHHVTGLYGNFGKVMAEATKYMPGIELDAMEDYGVSLG